MIGFFASAESCRSKENHRILDLFAAESRQRLKKLRHYPDEASVGAVQESWILISQWRALQRRRRSVGGNHCFGSCFSGLLCIAARLLPALGLLIPDPCSLIPVLHLSTIATSNRILKCEPQIQQTESGN